MADTKQQPGNDKALDAYEATWRWLLNAGSAAQPDGSRAEADGVLVAHPERERLAAFTGNGNRDKNDDGGEEHLDLDSVLWDDLAQSERAATLKPPRSQADRSAVSYWLRRQRVAEAHEWAWTLSRLPDVWRLLLEMTPSTQERLAVTLGLEMIAYTSAAMPAENRATFLQGLNEAHRTHVVRRMIAVNLNALPDSVRDCWIDASQRQVERRPERAARYLGLSLLAELLTKTLSEPLRAAAARHSQSDLFDVLSRGSKTRLLPDPANAGESINRTDVSHAIEALIIDVSGRLLP